MFMYLKIKIVELRNCILHFKQNLIRSILFHIEEKYFTNIISFLLFVSLSGAFTCGCYLLLLLPTLMLKLFHQSDDLLEVLKSDWFDSPDNYSYEVNHMNDLSTTSSSSTQGFSFADPLCEERKFFCTCGRTYKSKGSLTDHQRWECGKDPTFQCPYCEYCAKRKKHLRRHVICVHKKAFDENTTSTIIVTKTEAI